jgi:hypothetical protein
VTGMQGLALVARLDESPLLGQVLPTRAIVGKQGDCDDCVMLMHRLGSILGGGSLTDTECHGLGALAQHNAIEVYLDRYMAFLAAIFSSRRHSVRSRRALCSPSSYTDCRI